MDNKFSFFSGFIFIVLVSFFIFIDPCSAQKISPGVKRILFLGNSITYQGDYISDIEAYFIIKYPGRSIEFINAGLPSETVSGLSEPGHAGGSFPRPDLHERLARVLALVKPDMVFACYGMNDGIYMPLDAGRFQKFKDGINWLHNEVVKTGAGIIHLSPPHYDELRGKSAGYENVLEHYTNWLMNQISVAGWEVVDIFHPMKKYVQAHRKVDAKFAIDGFDLAHDGIHPGEAGHFIMAKQVLLYLGFKDVTKATGINDLLKNVSEGKQVFELIVKRQALMRDAWLSATGYIRPGLPQGIPLDEAKAISAEMSRKIDTLVNFLH
jgi:lysophospholipase L1-like esterase